MSETATPQSSPSVLVVIVNYRTPELAIASLHSLAAEANLLPQLRVSVVDNASGDNSVAAIGQAIAQFGWERWVQLLPSETNGGYAFGNNMAIRPMLWADDPPDYIWLLNPDTVVRPGAALALLDFMQARPEVGLAGSRLEDPDGTPQRSAFRFHTWQSEFERGMRLGLVSQLLGNWVVAPPVSDIACPTDWVAGASLIVRRSVFEAIGLMDEEYFLYFEEVDFCLQARRAGWECWYVPESRVVHLVGQSSGVTDTKKPPKRLPQYWFDSRQRFFRKNYGRFYSAIADLVWVIGFAIWQARRRIQGKPDTDPPQVFGDFLRNSAFAKVRSPVSSPPARDPDVLGLWAQIKEDWIAHDRDWTRPGFRAVAVQRFGVWRMQVEPKLLRAPLSLFYRALYRKVRNTYGIELPYSVQLGRRVIIEHQSAIVIHGDCIIGDDSIIRQGVTMGNRYVDRPFDAPKLGKRVNVGAGAKILGGVTLGDDACVGANAVVLCDVPPGATAVGIPAKIVREIQNSDSAIGEQS